MRLSISSRAATACPNALRSPCFLTANVFAIDVPSGNLSLACQEPEGWFFGRMNRTPGAPLVLDARSERRNS